MKKKQTQSLATGIIACILILAGYLMQANGIFSQTGPASTLQTSEEIVQEIQLQAEALHVIYWDVGQADCILIQNKRKKFAHRCRKCRRWRENCNRTQKPWC